MAAQRQDSSHEGSRGTLRLTPATPAASTPVSGDGLDTARGVGWGLLLSMVAFWAPMLALSWKWLHR